MSRPGVKITPVTLYSSRTEIKSSFDEASKSWICLTCGEEFNLLESMGNLGCFQHPGYIQNDERWSCCGQRIHSMRWLPSRDIQRMYVSSFVPHPTKVKGCQACDHNTSGRAYTHKDQQSISSLSAILPFMNKEFPFILRKGFERGVLRRCETRQLHTPPIYNTVVYQDDEGNVKEYEKGSGPVPQTGMELSASTSDGKNVTCWW
jgi:hypothetical protein